MPDAHEVVRTPLPTVIDAESFTPRLLALLSNSLVWRESRVLRARFGLGTNDWRVLSTLAIQPGSTATDVSEFIGVNKAKVSQSVAVLTDRGLIVQEPGGRRSRLLYLTRAGAAMHGEMLPVSMRGQEIILEGLDAERIGRLNALLRELLERAKELQAEDPLGLVGEIAEEAEAG